MNAKIVPIFAAFALAACVTPTFAEDENAPAMGSANTEAGQYEIDPTHTHVQFSVNRFGFNDVIGAFPAVTGTIALDRQAPEASFVTAEIGVASLVSGDPVRNEHVLGQHWLNAEGHPMMSFQSTDVVLTGDNEADVTGELTLLGVTKPVTLHVVMNKIGADPATKREAAGFSANGVINRSDFGISVAAGLVGDEVAIRIETLAHKVED